jgi:CDP-glucose 4,6-dehydratase
MTGEWAGRSVLVTGGRGHVGAWLIRALLSRGARVTRLDRDEAPGCLAAIGVSGEVACALGSIRIPQSIKDALRASGADTVFHLAAVSDAPAAAAFPMEAFGSNIEGTWNVLEASHLYGVERMVVASSIAAYASSSGRLDEESPLGPLHPYGASKASADLLARTYAAEYGTPVTVARCTNVHGGGDPSTTRLVPVTIHALLGGRRPIIGGDGSTARDYLHVEDAVEAYLRLAERAADDGVRGRAFNIATGTSSSVLEVVRALITIHGDPIEPDIRPDAASSAASHHVDVTRARDLLGWTAAHDLESGLRKTYAWYALRAARP